MADHDRDSMVDDVMPSSKKSTNDETDAPAEGQESPSAADKRMAMAKSQSKFMKKKERKKAEKAAALQKQIDEENQF